MTKSNSPQYKPYKVRFDCVFPFPAEAGNDVVRISKHLTMPASTAAPAWWLARHQSSLPAAGGVFFAEQQEDTLTIRNGADTNLDIVCGIISEVMERHDIQDIIHIQAGFESEYGSAGRYGGIAAAIMGDGFRLLDTNFAARDLAEALRLSRLAEECEAKFPGYLDNLRRNLEREAG